MKKNKTNLTDEQKLILFEEGTEAPGSSELNNEKIKLDFIEYNENKLFASYLGKSFKAELVKEDLKVIMIFGLYKAQTFGQTKK